MYSAESESGDEFSIGSENACATAHFVGDS